MIQTVQDAIKVFADSALGFALAMALAGTLAMAILQVIKELTPLRRRYQQRWIERWFDARAAKFAADVALVSPNLGGLDAAKAKRTLVELATGGETNAFYDLTAEQMVAQMNAAAQAALEYPTRYFELLAIVAQGASVEDISRVSAGPARGATSGATGGAASDPGFMEARNRVGHRIQRNLDGIQIALSSRWKLWMQGSALGLTVIIIEIAIALHATSGPGDYAIGIIVGIVGGYLAPVTRDLVAALQSLRKG